MQQIIQTDKAPAAIGPYSQAVVHNGMLYASGQIGINPENGEIAENTEDQTRQVMKNMGEVLAAADSGFDKVIKCSIFVKDLNDFALINSIYGEYFEKSLPARETVEVSRLPKDVRVEISCIAYCG